MPACTDGTHAMGTTAGGQEARSCLHRALVTSQGGWRGQKEEAKPDQQPLKKCSSSIHISQVGEQLGHTKFGIYHEGGAPEIAWNVQAKMAAEPTKVDIACHISRTGPEQQGEETQLKERSDGARFWAQSLPTCGQADKECNQQRGRTLRGAADQLRSETDSCRVRARHRWRLRWP